MLQYKMPCERLKRYTNNAENDESKVKVLQLNLHDQHPQTSYHPLLPLPPEIGRLR